MIIPLLNSGLPAHITRSGRMLYKSVAHLELEFKHFSESSTKKIQSCKLDFHNVLQKSKKSGGWEAVTYAVSRFYKKNHNTQETIIGVKRGGAKANQVKEHKKLTFLDYALQLTGNFNSSAQDHISPQHIQNEINNNRPVCILLKLEGSKKDHYVVVYGYTINKQNRCILHVADPWDGYHDVDYEYFSEHFKAQWSNTYLTTLNAC